MRRILLIFLIYTTNLYCQDKIQYPVAEQSNQTDTIFGNIVKDPYRWMEDIKSPKVQEWLKAEEKITKKYSGETSTLNDYLKYYNSILYKPLFRSGKYYFSFGYNNLFDKTSELYYQEGVKDAPEELFDPNTLEKNAVISIDGIKMSEDNSALAIVLSKNGSDWKTIRFLKMKKEKLMGDTLNFVKYSNVDWYKNGVFYYRYNVKETDDAFKGLLKYKTLYYHILGTKQSEDKMVYRNTSMGDVDFQFFPKDNYVIKYGTFHVFGTLYYL